MKGQRPLIDTIQPGAEGAANAMLPPGRKIAADRLDSSEVLYEYQAAAVNHLCGSDGPFGASGSGVAYLQMDTGLGKTRVGCAVVARRGEVALVVVPTDPIATQWVEEFAESYPGLKVDVYRNPPKKSRRVPPSPATHDVIVIIVNTFRAKTPAFMEGFGLVILDEAHEYHSQHNSRALWLSQTSVVLGLSATPIERPDEMDRYVPLHLGPVIYPATIPGFDVNAVNFRGEVRVVEYAGHPDHCEVATSPSGMMSAIMTIGCVIQDPYRLNMVAAEVERIYHLHETSTPEEAARLGLGPRPEADATAAHPAGEIRRHGVFVFAEHRNYLPILRAALLKRLSPEDVLTPELDAAPTASAAATATAATAAATATTTATATATATTATATTATAKPDSISMLRGGAAKNAVGNARRAGAHIVLTTFGFSRRGISLSDMTAIVIATSRRNGHRQVLGRFLRLGSDESIVRQVVDVVDVNTGLRGQYLTRSKVYREKGYRISKVAASWEQFAGPECEPPSVEPPVGEDLTVFDVEELLAAAMGDVDRISAVRS